MTAPEMKSPGAAATATEAHADAASRHLQYTESPAARLLARLDKVQDRGHGQHLACCPAHDDRTPSLSVKETGDGTLLLKCWAGCEAAEIVAAVGLTMTDLFPDSGRAHRRPKRRYERRVGPKDTLAALAYEATVITVIASGIKERQDCSAEAFERLAQAAARIGAAKDEYA